MKIIVAVGEAGWIFLLIVSERMVGCPGVTANESRDLIFFFKNDKRKLS
jgi:hypothetical protein